MNNIKKVILMVIFSIITIILLLVKINNNNNMDIIKYKGNTYVYLEYNMDIFTYYYNNINNDYLEEDIIYPIKHKKWDIVYFNGDLFVLKDQVRDAKKYYSDDDNYEWLFVLDNEDEEIEYSISITPAELKYIYNMDNMKKEETLSFDEIKNFGSIKKISKDNLISSVISLAYYNGSWYYKTEIMNGDLEYIIKLPDTLNKKIINLQNKQ